MVEAKKVAKSSKWANAGAASRLSAPKNNPPAQRALSPNRASALSARKGNAGDDYGASPNRAGSARPERRLANAGSNLVLASRQPIPQAEQSNELTLAVPAAVAELQRPSTSAAGAN